jgi:hypothetical protein
MTARLKPEEYARKSQSMIRFFDMDDRSRLPWRFHRLPLALRLRG